MTIESEALLKDTMEEVEEAKKLIFGGIHGNNRPSASVLFVAIIAVMSSEKSIKE